MGQVKLPELSYTVDRSGPVDGEHPKRRDSVTVNYTLTLPDGKVIDKSDAPVTFPLARLIPAWQILVPMMRPGDAWTFYVPSEYGYGPQAMGEMPANAFLIFKVELIAIAPAALPATTATTTPPPK
jgi:peptidylprolyl isomerase/FKBP-type peptidyl-prolyl cis-trans isomerase FklB